jgi:hypothetical protein
MEAIELVITNPRDDSSIDHCELGRLRQGRFDPQDYLVSAGVVNYAYVSTR